MKSIRTKLLLGFAIVLLLVVFMSGFTIINSNKTNNIAEELVTDNLEELIIYQTLRFNVAERIAVTRGYLLYGDQELKDKFFSYTEESKELEKKLEGYLSETERNAAEEVIKKSIAWGNYITEEVYGVYDTNQELAIENNKLSRDQAVELMNLLGNLVEEEDKAVHDLGDQILSNAKTTETYNLTLSIIVILAGIAIALVVANIIVKPILKVVERLQAVADGDFTGDALVTKSKDEVGILTTTMNKMVTDLRAVIEQVRFTSEQVAASSEELTASAEQTSTATEQISTAIQEVSEGSSEQLSTVNKSNDIVVEISKGMTQVADSIQSVAHLTVEATEKVTEGNRVVNSTIDQMNDVQKQVLETSTVINALDMKSKEIGQIVELISQIASQTNLLALNAAIEAARAGEHGLGFAVVADEVRKLAEQSGQAAGQISSLIGDIQSETLKAVTSMERGTSSVNDGINLVAQTGSSFNEISSRIEVISSQSQEVSAIVEQVTAGSSDMVAMIENVANFSEQSAGNAQNVAASAEEQLASMEEISSSAQSLSTMAEELQNLVRKFKI
ncbi:methyl-accepting chemotaxis protein [Litchfieldia salsa]|uniref:Methyl-accepting chemotaxis protein n=1 Tax=Litchfieldia salsa TaxID=930152 RepID=A0A1H0UQX4_9BACI|nr:methyl-accepting chemotaxis protein [Litchfieldia salsa]SDP68531.1 methyl-accepting chemotaxis protein [Litchfieldia salsa]